MFVILTNIMDKLLAFSTWSHLQLGKCQGQIINDTDASVTLADFVMIPIDGEDLRRITINAWRKPQEGGPSAIPMALNIHAVAWA
eukprot:Skav235880  [mRNA]  locus=scaffold1192:83180:83434:+ [translate_table: standard]